AAKAYCDQALTLVVDFPKAEELKLLVEVEGGGEGACAGYVTANPGQKYYPPGAEVMVTATAHPGYTFLGWEGDGEAWIMDGHSHGDPYSGGSDPLEEITEAEIFLKMGNTTEESSVREVTAVFVAS